MLKALRFLLVHQGINFETWESYAIQRARILKLLNWSCLYYWSGKLDSIHWPSGNEEKKRQKIGMGLGIGEGIVPLRLGREG